MIQETRPGLGSQEVITVQGGILPVDPDARLQTLFTLLMEEAQRAAIRKGRPMEEILAETAAGTSVFARALLSFSQDRMGAHSDETLFPRQPFYDLETAVGVVKLATNDRLLIHSPLLSEGQDHDPVRFTDDEWIIVEDLARHQGITRTRSQISVRLLNLTDESYYKKGHSRTIDTHVSRARAKMGDINGEIVESVRWLGYRFSVPRQEHSDFSGIPVPKNP